MDNFEETLLKYATKEIKLIDDVEVVKYIVPRPRCQNIDIRIGRAKRTPKASSTGVCPQGYTKVRPKAKHAQLRVMTPIGSFNSVREAGAAYKISDYLVTKRCQQWTGDNFFYEQQ